MKASKLIVLVGGLLGVIAFFLPLVSVHRGGDTATLSAFAVVKGGDSVAISVTHDGEKQKVEIPTDTENGDVDLDKIKGILSACFVPSVLIALIGVIGVARGKFGRLGGVFALLLGLVGLGLALLMKSGAGNDSGIGLTLLLVGGALGALGGLLALVSPDRGAAAA